MTPLTIPPSLRDGRYTIGDELGSGGMAVVHHAVDNELGVARAVKILLPSDSAGSIRKRLRNEARAMAQLHHPHILGIHDVGTEDDHDWILMDLAEGGSLQQLVAEQGPLPLEMAIGHMVKVLSALAAAHAAGIIHRDVKPHNILLAADGRPLLADFGIAMLAEDDRSTRTGVAMGSLSFMPPEQRLDAAHVGPTADVYACGCTLFALLTNDNPVDLFLAAPDSHRWSGVPLSVRTIVQKACAPHPTDRYPTAGAFGEALLDVLHGLAPDERARALDGRGFFPPPSESLSPGRGRTPAPRPRAAIRPTDATIPQRPIANPTLAPAPPPPRVWLIRGAMAVGVVLLLLLLVSLGPGLLEGAPLADTHEASLPVEAVPVDVGPLPMPAEVAPPEPVAPPTPVEPPPQPQPQPQPTPAVRAPAPKEAPEAPSASPSSITGDWQGSLNGSSVRMQLFGSDRTLKGTFVVRWAGKEDQKVVRGSYDPQRRVLHLEDVDDGEDTGEYTLTVDGARMTGQFRRRAGGERPLSLHRPRG